MVKKVYLFIMIGLIIISLCGCKRDKDTTNRKELYELAVDIGYKGTFDQWDTQVRKNQLIFDVNYDKEVYIYEDSIYCKVFYENTYYFLIDIVSLPMLIDPNGIGDKEIAYRLVEDNIQYHFKEDEGWANLISLPTLVDPRGNYDNDDYQYKLFHTDTEKNIRKDHVIKYYNEEDAEWKSIVDIHLFNDNDYDRYRLGISEGLLLDKRLEIDEIGHTIFGEHDVFSFQPDFSGEYIFSTNFDTNIILEYGNEVLNNVIDNKVTYYLEKDKKYIYKVLSDFSFENYQVNISSQTIEVGNNSFKLDNDKVLFFNFKPDKGDIYQLKTNSSTKISIYERTSIKDNKLTEVRTNIDGTNLMCFHFEEGKEYYISITSINKSDLQFSFNPVRNLSELELKFDENNIIEYKDQNASLGDRCYYFIAPETGTYNYYYMLDVVTRVFEKNIRVLFYLYSDGEFIATAEMPFYYGEFDFKHNIKEYLKKGDVIIFGYINNSYVENELSYKIFRE